MNKSMRTGLVIAAAVASLVAASCLAPKQNSVAAASGALPRHIMTYILWGASENRKGLPGVDVHQAAQWVSWTIAKGDDTGALRAAGIHTMYYTDPNRIAPQEKIWIDDESAFAHDCSGARIRITKPGSQKLLTDPSSPALQQRWRDYVHDLMAHGQYEAMYDDTAGTTGSLSALPCHFDENTWIQQHAKLVDSLGVPVIYNGLGDGDLPRHGRGPRASFDLSPGIGISAARNALGGSFEDCYTTGGQMLGSDGKTLGSYWQQTENTEIIMAQRGKIFMCENMADKGATFEGSIDQRMYAYSSLLLTVDPATTMVHQIFHSPSHVDVGPEVGLVPSEPVISSVNSIDALRTSGGAYVREYRACYLNGSPIGACAAAVNSDPDRSAGLSLSGYHHTLVLSGSGVLDGGTATVNGSAPPSSLGPLTGIVATK